MVSAMSSFWRFDQAVRQAGSDSVGAKRGALCTPPLPPTGHPQSCRRRKSLLLLLCSMLFLTSTFPLIPAEPPTTPNLFPSTFTKLPKELHRSINQSLPRPPHPPLTPWPLAATNLSSGKGLPVRTFPVDGKKVWPFFFLYCCAGWGYIVAFTKVLTVYCT
jgi:hypothetical protein